MEIYRDYEQWSINDNIQEQEVFEQYNPVIQTMLIAHGDYIGLKPINPSYQPTYRAASLEDAKRQLRKFFE